jgi:hypothetical protein
MLTELLAAKPLKGITPCEQARCSNHAFLKA